MNRHAIQRWQQFAAAALALLLVSTAHASAPAPSPAQEHYEIDFLSDMIDHHSMAIQMATTCETNATHPELRDLCSDIRTSQQQEITLMQMWLADWYGVNYQPQMKSGAMRHIEKMAALSGAEYEIEFMQTMIRHHKGAIREASHCLDRAYHDDLVELCEAIIEVQLMEIQLMQDWLCDWYGICKRQETT